MVKVKNDLRMLPTEFLGILNCAFGHITEKGLVSVVAGSLGNLKDNR